MQHILTETADRVAWLSLATAAAELARELRVRVRFEIGRPGGAPGFYGRVTTESPELLLRWRKLHAASG